VPKEAIRDACFLYARTFLFWKTLPFIDISVATADWYWIAAFRYAWYTNESAAPTRGIGLAAGVIPEPNDGLYGPCRTDDHRRARVLPHDQLPMRTNADVEINRLLPEGCAKWFRQHAGDKVILVAPPYRIRCLVSCLPVGESGLF